MTTTVKFPATLLEPIRKFLKRELSRMKKTREGIKDADPFKDESRVGENSVEEDVDEQLDHFDAQVKANFVGKQIVQLRKALTMIKVGKYGICEKCGKMIDTDRLAIRPETTVCIDCERDSE